MNVLRITRNRSAPILENFGEEVVLKDEKGVSLLSYGKNGSPPYKSNYVLGTPGFWLDPLNESVRTYLSSLMKELVSNYSDLSGVHFDMIRYPLASKKKEAKSFRNQFRLAHEVSNVDKRKAVSDLVARMNRVVKSESSKIEVSSAVISNKKKAYSHVFQDWPLWLEEGYLDTAIPMNYNVKHGAFRKNTEFASSLFAGKKIMMGIGAWLFKSESDLRKQIEISLNNQVDGVTFFSYANIKKHKHLERFFLNFFSNK